MNAKDSIVKCLKNYFNGKGRASRSEFWWFALLYYAALYGSGEVISSTASGVLSLVVILLVIPLWNAGFRRLHDVGVRGWFMLIPIVNIYLLASKGDANENKFGAPPEK